nr:hypothetical protein [uncultured Porphyromonas sp.]
MLYYHVRIEREGPNKPNELYYEWDATDLSEIKKRIMMPYSKEKRVRISGHELPASSIISIVIVESQWSQGAYYDALCKKYPNEPGLWNPSLIFNEDESYVRNITDNLREECELDLMNPVRRFFLRVKKILQK